MADTWELICHHTYAGIPGVVADISPAGESHGWAPGLDDGDFLTHGVAPGSGALRFYKSGGRVHVPANPASKAWHPLGGVKAEVTLRREPRPLDVAYTVIHSDAFHFYIRSGDNLVAWFRGEPLSYDEISVVFDPVGAQAYRVPHGRWVTLGFVHDGLSAMELYADGQLIARRNGQFARVATVGPGGVAIGNTSTGDGFLNGEIDEVKIWRLNPHRVDEEFFSRPVDSETAECWARFFRSLAAALDRYPDCAQLLQRLIPEMVERLRRAIVAKGPETRERFDRASAEYRQLWRAGAIDGPDMAKLIGDWWAWLQLVGISIENDPGLAELHASECMRRLLAEVEAPDCDRQMVDLLQRLMASVGQQSRGERSRA